MKRGIGIFAIFLLTLLNTGCSAKFMTLDLNYVPQNLPMVTHKSKLFIEKFDDVREKTEPKVVGVAKTGAFNVATPLLLRTTVSEALTDIFKKTFAESGAVVVNNKVESDLILKGRINNFWIQEHATGWTPEYAEANIELDLTLLDSKNEKSLWYDVKLIHEKSKGGFMDATGYDQIVMNDAVKGLMRDLMKDSKLMGYINNKYPSEGNQP